MIDGENGEIPVLSERQIFKNPPERGAFPTEEETFAGSLSKGMNRPKPFVMTGRFSYKADEAAISGDVCCPIGSCCLFWVMVFQPSYNSLMTLRASSRC